MLRKKFFAAIMAFALILTAFPVSAFASPSLDDQLRSRGYPDALIGIMLDEEKQELINDDCYYESSITCYFNESGELIDDCSSEEPSIIPFKQIDKKHLSLTISASKSGSNTVITCNYRWLVPPVNRFSDPICVGWDKNVFYMIDDSFSKVDKYGALIQAKPDSYYEAVHSSENGFASSTAESVTWYADLKGYTADVISLFGYGKFTLVPRKKGQVVTIFANYVHAKLAGSLSVSFAGGSFSISGFPSHDQMGVQRNITS